MKLLDDAVSVAQRQEERQRHAPHSMAAADETVAQGVSPERAEQLASVRMFSVPSGAYGTNLDKTIPLSNTYGTGKEADDKLSSVYFMRMHHAFGQGLWGESAEDRPDLGGEPAQGRPLGRARPWCTAGRRTCTPRSTATTSTSISAGTAMAIRAGERRDAGGHGDQHGQSRSRPYEVTSGRNTWAASCAAATSIPSGSRP